MNGPSEHLTWGELACKDEMRTPYPFEWRETRGRRLGSAYEAFRKECGDGPLHVLSGYRTPEHNGNVPGAASKSEHTQGTAVDIAKPLWIVSYGEFLASAFRARDKRPDLIKGIGIYPGRQSIHIDIRETEYLATWTG